MQIFRLLTTLMKINQIPCDFSSRESTFFKILHHSLHFTSPIIPLKRSCSNNICLPQVSFPLSFASILIPMKLSSSNIICFGQIEPIKEQFSRLLSSLMKVHPIPQAIFETQRSGFIQIFHYCSVPWKITPLYYCSSNLVNFRQKEPIEKHISDFWLIG